MKRDLFFPYLWVFALFTLFMAGPSPYPVAHANDLQLEMAPHNPEFVRFFEKTAKRTSDDGPPLGYIPPPVDLSHVQGMGRAPERALSFPDAYDLRHQGKLTAVRDQGSCGSCWTFATYAALESFLKPAEAWDFSEQDLNENHGFDYAPCNGGNAFMSQAYLARWDGPLRESEAPYPYAANPQAADGPSKHVQEVVLLPRRSSYTDNDAIKDFLTTYGALYFAFYYNGTYYNAATHSYYNPSTASGNHAVAVVGWDDHYDKNNFPTVPPGNGAFIAKNSWGTDWGDNGFFYISYYDVSLQEFVAFNNAEATTNYDGLYQYDPLGYVGNIGYGSTTAWAANVFTATDNHLLSAIGFITNDTDTAYTIYIYTGVTANQPRSGTLSATQAGTHAYPGYYTAQLDSPVALTRGTAFSIVIRFENASYVYPVPVEYKAAGYSSGATSNPGESFVSADGSTWQDFYDRNPSYYVNNTIKGFFVDSAPLDLYVSSDGDCCGKSPCYSTLQAALTAAGDGATIKVEAGQYPEAPENSSAATVSISGGWNERFTEQTGTTEMYAPRLTGGGGLKLLPNIQVVAP